MTKREQDAARADVLAAANRYRRGGALRRPRLGGFVYAPKPLTMRHINEAVCIVRQNRLLPGAALEAAGFRAERRR